MQMLLKSNKRNDYKESSQVGIEPTQLSLEG